MSDGNCAPLAPPARTVSIEWLHELVSDVTRALHILPIATRWPGQTFQVEGIQSTAVITDVFRGLGLKGYRCRWMHPRAHGPGQCTLLVTYEPEEGTRP